MIRKRGFILFLAGIPAWIYWLGEFVRAKRSPFGSEFGSAEYPIPTYLRVIGLFAAVSTLVGLSLIAFDLVEWLRRKRNDVIH